MSHLTLILFKRLLEEGYIKQPIIKDLFDRNQLKSLEMLNELTVVLHFDAPESPVKPPKASLAFTVNSKDIAKEENKQQPPESKSSGSVEIEVNNRKYPPEELVLFKHFKLTLEVFFQSFAKASISNITKGAKLIASLANFSLNAWQKKISKKKNLHASELKFIEEVYSKNKPIYDDIVAVNILVFLVRSGICRIEKDAKLGYNLETANSIIHSKQFD